MEAPKKKPKLTDLQLKDLRIEQLESEIQTMRKAYIKKQEDVITLSEALARLYKEKIAWLEKDTKHKELEE